MAKLSQYMKTVVEEQKLGFVSTICADNTPNLSPKGTFLVLDDDQLMFGEIRSPNTRKNIGERPVMEVNFVDVFARKGFRAKGTARFVERGTPEFDGLIPKFNQWGDLCDQMNGIVILRIDRALPLSSPAYDMGAKESDLRTHWQTYFHDIQSN